MEKTWVVAVNHHRARVFEAGDRVGRLEEIEDLIEPSARLQVKDLESDAPTRSPGDASTGPHAGEPKRNAKKQESIRFAKRIAGTLQSGRQEGRYGKLYLLAEPAVMGLLRDALDSSTRSLVAGEVSSNLVTQSPQKIRAHLPDFL